jgi:hypothetical protein
MKTLNQYKGQAFKLFTEQNIWKYKAIEEMLNMSIIQWSWSDRELFNKWWNESIKLHDEAKKLFESLESPLSYRAYQRAAKLADMFDVKAQQLINYLESVNRL